MVFNSGKKDQISLDNPSLEMYSEEGLDYAQINDPKAVDENLREGLDEFVDTLLEEGYVPDSDYDGEGERYVKR